MVDATDEALAEQLEVTRRVVVELGAADTAMWLLFNKIDRCDPERRRERRASYPEAIQLSVNISVNTIDRNARFDSEHRHCVTATVDPSVLGELRAALAPTQCLHVVVTTAATWGGRSELRYRAARVTVDQEVRRVEITCTGRQLETVLSAVGDLVARGAAQVLRIDDSREASSPSQGLGLVEPA